MTYFDILRKRGYKPFIKCKYKGVCTYEKCHLHHKIVCFIKKDWHGKAQEITFKIYSNSGTPRNMNDFHEVEFHREYLVKEANYIANEFNKLKERH